MRRLQQTVFWIAAAGTLTSSIYGAMVTVAAVRFGRRKRREDREPLSYLPPVSVLKPLHGSEPGLEESLHGFFVQRYPKYEVLFCARQETDAGLLLARRVAAAYPNIATRFLVAGEPQFPNAKMWSLAALAEAARYPTLVTSDADARVNPDYLARCVQALADGTTRLASCLYVGQTEGGLAAQLDAVGKSVEMTGGILVAEMVEGGTRFALGVTMILDRTAFQTAGGYEDLGQYQAEDFVLGKRLAAAGLGVRMSNHVVRLMVLPQSFGASFNDQLRWMKSTRRSRPAGHLGTGLTFAVPYGLLGFAWGCLAGLPGAGLFWFLATCAARSAMAAVVLWALGAEQPIKPICIYPVRDLLGGAVWMASYAGSRVRYHGGAYELDAHGRFRSAQAKTSAQQRLRRQTAEESRSSALEDASGYGAEATSWKPSGVARQREA